MKNFHEDQKNKSLQDLSETLWAFEKGKVKEGDIFPLPEDLQSAPATNVDWDLLEKIGSKQTLLETIWKYFDKVSKKRIAWYSTVCVIITPFLLILAFKWAEPRINSIEIPKVISGVAALVAAIGITTMLMGSTISILLTKSSSADKFVAKAKTGDDLAQPERTADKEILIEVDAVVTETEELVLQNGLLRRIITSKRFTEIYRMAAVFIGLVIIMGAGLLYFVVSDRDYGTYVDGYGNNFKIAYYLSDDLKTKPDLLLEEYNRSATRLATTGQILNTDPELLNAAAVTFSSRGDQFKAEKAFYLASKVDPNQTAISILDNMKQVVSDFKNENLSIVNIPEPRYVNREFVQYFTSDSKVKDLVDSLRTTRQRSVGENNAFVVGLESLGEKEEAWQIYKMTMENNRKVDPLLIVNLRSFLGDIPIARVVQDTQDLK